MTIGDTDYQQILNAMGKQAGLSSEAMKVYSPPGYKSWLHIKKQPPKVKMVGDSIIQGTPSSTSYTNVLTELSKVFPNLLDGIVGYPCDCNNISQVSLSTVIMHLNDEHRWSRERIAAWTETLDLDLTIQPAQTGD